MAGALAEIARHSLAKDFRHFDPGSAKIVLVEGGPGRAGEFSGTAARRRAPRSGAAGRRGAHRRGRDAHRSGLRADRRAARSPRRPSSGPPASRPSPLGATLGAPLDRVGRVLVQPDLTIPGHPDVFVIGDLASLAGPSGRPLPGVAQVAMQMGAHAARNILRAVAGQPLRPFVYRNLGDMATIGRASAVADLPWIQLKGLVGLAGLAVRPHLQSDRLPQPPRRDGAMGVVVFQLSARDPADHRRRQRASGRAAHDRARRLGRGIRRRRGRGAGAVAGAARRTLVLARAVSAAAADPDVGVERSCRLRSST